MKLKNFKYLDIIIDNPNSWMWQYIPMLENILNEFTQNVRIFENSKEMKNGDILFILSCDKILKLEDLNKHINNIVIHESDLPKGKGWSPLSYQVERGLNSIPVTLFEADVQLDSGKWYIKDFIELNGTELINEIRNKQALKSFDMIKEYLTKYPVKAIEQTGTVTHYQKRTSKNQELDINNAIKEQFNLLRVCDNDNYPAYFFIDNKKYILKIEEVSND